MKILCVGELLVDMIGSEKTIVKSKSFDRRPGGAPANVAVAASRMGAEVDLAATIGNDPFGEMLESKMKDENIGVSNIRRVNENTTLAFVALDDDSKPEFSFHRGADQYIQASQLNEGYDIVHVGSLPLTRKESSENIISFLESTDAKISFDPNLREELVSEAYLETINKLVNISDMIFLSEEEYNQLDISEEKEVILTKGKKGAEIHGSDSIYFAEPPKVSAIDTTGAGDALTGSYLAHRLEGIDSALEIAVKAAAISTTEKGAMTALPKKEEL